MEFRPCIDIHNGKVKQIIGGSLKDAGDQATENYVAEQDAVYFAKLYQKEGIKGGHIILLNPASSTYYKETRAQAELALGAYPGGLQIGGGITAENAKEFLGGFFMSGALMNKVWDLFGMDTAEPDEYDEENIYDYDNNEEEVEDKKIFGRKNNNKVVNMPQAQSQAIKMVISQPTTFEQSDEICSFLKEKKSVIVNLEYVNKDVARRIVDFISGGVYALDGYIQKVSNSIFLVAPSNYEITNEMAREEIKNKLSVSWLKNNNVNN